MEVRCREIGRLGSISGIEERQHFLARIAVTSDGIAEAWKDFKLNLPKNGQIGWYEYAALVPEYSSRAWIGCYPMKGRAKIQIEGLERKRKLTPDFIYNTWFYEIILDFHFLFQSQHWWACLTLSIALRSTRIHCVRKVSPWEKAIGLRRSRPSGAGKINKIIGVFKAKLSKFCLLEGSEKPNFALFECAALCLARFIGPPRQPTFDDWPTRIILLLGKSPVLFAGYLY